MEYIHPKLRFSKNTKSLSFSPPTLKEAIHKFGRLSPDNKTQLLAGGFMNANFLVSDEKSRFVFRVSSNGSRSAQMERDILRFLKPTQVLVPEVYDTVEVEGASITVMEYIEGITLEDKLLSAEGLNMNLYAELGRQLAHIHNIQFEKAGFIGPGVFPGGEYENSGAFLKEYLDKSLTGLEAREDRLALDKNKRLRHLLDDKWNLVLSSEKAKELVHCDFNPKNILVSKGEEASVLAILDWEFSWVGNGLMDFGNFFRFSYDYPSQSKESMVQAYRELKPDLPENWEDVSRIIDVGNMCFFLERKEDYQESFHTARSVIEATLKHFDY